MANYAQSFAAEDQLICGRVRETCLAWAMQTSTDGEDGMAILARAHLYEDYLTDGPRFWELRADSPYVISRRVIEDDRPR